MVILRKQRLLVLSLLRLPRNLRLAAQLRQQATGDLWLDTSQSPVLKFMTALSFFRRRQKAGCQLSTPLARLSRSWYWHSPAIRGRRLSSRIATTQRGAANGVASLDSSGRLPSAQLPTSISSGSFYKIVSVVSNSAQVTSGYLNNAYKLMQSVVCSSGTGTVNTRNGVNVGQTVNVSSSDNSDAVHATRNRRHLQTRRLVLT